MAHPSQLGFFAELIERFPDRFAGRVVDIGSADLNGGPHTLIDPEFYLGVDLAVQDNVDLVSDGARLALADASFDVAMSSECLEHDLGWSSTIANMLRVTRPSGLVAFSAASTGRPEHGTTRSDGGKYSPATVAIGREWYGNLTTRKVRRALRGHGVRTRMIHVDRRSCDIYVAAVVEPSTAEDRQELHAVRAALRGRPGPNRYPFSMWRRIGLRIGGDAGMAMAVRLRDRTRAMIGRRLERDS